MSRAVTHKKISTKPAPVDSTRIGGPDWNDEHVFTGGALGSLLVRDTTQTDGANWIDAVAAGAILTSTGIGSLPAWSATPSLTSLTTTSDINVSGQINFDSGTPSLAKKSAGALAFVQGGVNGVTVVSGSGPSLNMGSAGFVGWASTTDSFGGTVDVALFRGGAGIIDQRNGINAQAFRPYNTYTDSANYERAEIGWSGNAFVLATNAAGTGSQRALYLNGSPIQFRIGGGGLSGGTVKWQIDSSGNLITGTDGAVNIGASATGRPLSVFASDSFVLPSARLRSGTVAGGNGLYVRNSTDTSNANFEAAVMLVDTQILAGNGTNAVPAYAFTNATNYGFALNSGIPAAITNSTPVFRFGDGAASGLDLRIGVGFTSAIGTSPDAYIVRSGTGILEQRSGTTSQTLRINDTFTDSLNYTRGFFAHDTNGFIVGQEGAGTGTNKRLQIKVGGSIAWFWTASGHFSAATDNTYDIGASGANRPRNLYISGAATVGTTLTMNGQLNGVTDINMGSTYSLAWVNRCWIRSLDASTIQMLNNATNGSPRLVLGMNDTTNSGVSIGNSSGTMVFQKGDGSADIGVRADNLTASGTSGFTGQSATGTLVSNSAQTILDSGVISLGSTGIGALFVVNTEDGSFAQFEIRGASVASTVLMVGDGTVYSTAAGTAGKINVYWSATNSRYELENKRGATRTIRVVRIGV